jgi:hypothetical protein
MLPYLVVDISCILQYSSAKNPSFLLQLLSLPRLLFDDVSIHRTENQGFAYLREKKLVKKRNEK